MIALDGIMMFSQYFYPLLQSDSKGEILLATSKGIYFRLSDRIFQLTNASIGTTPVGIGIDNVGFLTSIGLKEGQPVHLMNGELRLPGAIVKLHSEEVGTHISFSPLLPALIQRCAQMLHTKSKPRSISSLCAPLIYGATQIYETTNPVCQIAYPLLLELIQAMRTANLEAITAAVNALIGMGVGLTPSADDVILGLMYGLLRLAPYAVSTKALTEAVIKYAPINTNAISAAYLQAVAEGGEFSRLDNILHGLSGKIPLDIEPMLEIGSSSGSEMLLGLLIAAKIIYL
ncbi:MAG: DUF2877 domain-containing protein [Oscillospiraceae bacterium]|nr:DUF2877 domain-containing protein [Oscillospiraceae bacterium]